MRRRALPILLALLLLGTGCALLRGRAGRVRVPPPAPPDGYVVREPRILFVFDPARYDSVTADGSWERLPLAGVRIATVHVVGDFNGWSRSAWLMTPEHRGAGARHTLEHTLVEIGAGKEYLFRFLVNGRWWVEPSPRTWNRRAARSVPGGHDLLLQLE